MLNLEEIRTNLGSRIANPIVRISARTGMSPDIVSSIGLAIDIGAAYLVATGHFFLGGVLVLIAGLFDLLDGALARFTRQTTKFGAILDSTFDRVSEAAIFCGLLISFMSRGTTLEIVLIFVALVGSFLVSYTRARAEGLGLECKVGLFTRAERVIVLAIGLLINQIFIALWVLVVFVYITVAQRLFYLWRQAKSKGG
jgi:CDP-diacylglycerol---glycerol-3-phosphate 3-phosphatidyltransferase